VVEAVPQAAPPVETAPLLPQRTKSDGSSPYDSKVKRAAQSASRPRTFFGMVSDSARFLAILTPSQRAAE